MTSARMAAFEVLYQHLNNASPLWATRVEPLTEASNNLGVDENGDRQLYLVFFEAAGGRRLTTPARRSAALTISVKVVGPTLAGVESGSDAISTLLDNSGDQDINPRLPYHADWRILTVTEDRAIYIEEKFAGAESIYHSGHQYRLVMEER